MLEEYELEDHHVRLLTLACESWDRATLAREAIAEHGLTYTDRFNSPRKRPEVSVAESATIATKVGLMYSMPRWQGFLSVILAIPCAAL